mmetsp:Transcript_67069/g.75102  ORF Transcript_67069/g.75102 Transcript_67069/m.75102 type:complete len:606 (-) Transcript_67069:93-1910(-)
MTILLTVAIILLTPYRAESFQTSSRRWYHHWKIPRESSLHQHQQQQQQQHNENNQQFPIPEMPSDHFRRMAQSQLELLANSLTEAKNPSKSKIQAMILYLPQENKYTGQLEFTPAVLYPDPSTERIFIASDAESVQSTRLPKSVSKLPGFSSAPDLLPGYPMIPFATDPGIGVVEEVMCDIRFKTCALSVPLLCGSQTRGVLLVSPAVVLDNDDGDVLWTKRDKKQVSLAAQSLSMALTMDNERNFLRNQNDVIRENLSDSLHQMKNPIQALRTYGKILQRQVVETTNTGSHNNDNNMDAADVGGGTSQLLEITKRLMVQSERVVEMMVPMDSLVEAMDWSNYPVLLPAARSDTNINKVSQSMVLWKDHENDFSSTEEEENTNSTLRLRLSIKEECNSQVNYINSENSLSSISIIDDEKYNSETTFGDFETELVFITDVLEPVFDTFRAIATEKGILFEVLVDDADDLPGVFVSPKSFQEAVSNVLDNALKYVVLPKAGSPFPNNPNPQVRLRIFPSQDPGVTILVEDNGPGVAVEDRGLIFQRGFRSCRTNIVGGRGIGLDIAQSLMTRMGGYFGLANDNEKFRDSLDGAVMRLEVTRSTKRIY